MRKEVCKRCMENKIKDLSSSDIQKARICFGNFWKSGKIYCEGLYDNEKINNWPLVEDEPKNWCPYQMEHLVLSQKDLKK